MPYDTKCHDLATAFLKDSPVIDNEKSRDQLAQHIQTQIEDWIEYRESPCSVCGQPLGADVHKDCIYF